MNEWVSPLTDILILFVLGALAGIGAMFGLGKPVSAALIFEAIFKNGSWAAGVGGLVIARVGKTIAACVAILVGAGLVGKKEIRDALRRVLGFSDNRDAP